MSLPASPAYRICHLRSCEQYVPVIAQWHHEQWLAGRTSATDTQSGCGLQKRIDSLRAHCLSAAMPATFVALLHGQPVGSVSLVYYRFTQQQQGMEWLTNVFVRTDQRGQGIGRALVYHACDYAAGLGVQALHLYTRDRGEFYRKLDWQDAGVARVHGSSVEILLKYLTPCC